jgi:uncharacterized membrane protein YhaH (DUF805 family)
VGFSEAIQSGFQNYVKFDGRSSRAAYWWWALFTIIVSVITGIIDRAIGSTLVTTPEAAGMTAGTVGIVTSIASLILFLPSLAVLVRRLHDTDRSGWWVLINVIPIIGWLVMLFFLLQPGSLGLNRYGPPPRTGEIAPAFQ